MPILRETKKKSRLILIDPGSKFFSELTELRPPVLRQTVQNLNISDS